MNECEVFTWLVKGWLIGLVPVGLLARGAWRRALEAERLRAAGIVLHSVRDKAEAMSVAIRIAGRKVASGVD